jgi:ech hydrogenase subunit A
MANVVFLLAFPAVIAALLLAVRNNTARMVIVVPAAVAIMVASGVLAVGNLLGDPFTLKVEGEWPSYVALAIDAVCCLFIAYKGVRHRNWLAIALALVQGAGITVFELTLAHGTHITNDVRIDGLSALMVLVIGIIGSGICVYALGYMKDFQAHEDASAVCGKSRDRRPTFFALMFVFLSAMFGVVFFNNLTWLLTAWEVTTVCSFALIGFTRTEEAIKNSFRQAVMNLVGGLSFTGALFWLVLNNGPLELDALVATGGVGLFAAPVMLLAVAGFTKAAQVPFQSWLLGAMVAPTPTSALLHSSTMVKAGVFLLIRLAPCLGWNFNGVTVALVGGLTFLFCSFMAISQSNAKRVLAYSTIANLGLIVLCAGIGTPEAVWAGIFLLLFHAAAKSLLFCCVGTAEHHIHSRDIEDMDNLFRRMPTLARLMALGIICMFIAPFGMLISKWAVLVSIANTDNLLLVLILAFGSAATFMFWAKWLGKVLAVSFTDSNVEKSVFRTEWASLGLMALLAAGLSIGFPLVSEFIVVPYLSQIAVGSSSVLQSVWAQPASAAIGFDNLLIMASMVLLLLAVFIVQFIRPGKAGGNVYLAGIALDNEKRIFKNALSAPSEATQRNWYLSGWFGEKRITPIANILCLIALVGGLALAFAGMGGLL